MAAQNNAERNNDNKKDSIWNIIKIKLRSAYWFRVISVIALLIVPCYLHFFFPIPDQAKQNWFWHSVASTPWIYLLILVIRGAIIIFLVWAVVKLVVADE